MQKRPKIKIDNILLQKHKVLYFEDITFSSSLVITDDAFCGEQFDCENDQTETSRLE